VRVFVQDPEPYLHEQQLTVQDPIDPSRPALVDAAHRSFVNYEIYYFADAENKRAFDATPLRWCGAVTDPVTRERFQPGDDSPRRERDGRVFYLASQTSAASFDAMPDMYVLPDYRMLPAAPGDAPESPADEAADPGEQPETP